MLGKIYGTVEVKYKFEAGTKPEDYRESPFYSKLKEIFSELQNHRGYKNFVRSQTLPRCDFFVPNPGFILEFDESQHFTACRKIALFKYPEHLELGFDREKWIKLCEKIDAMDNDPPYRDEQRAWYDTLRDFIPTIKGLKPTVRIFSQDLRWCSLNPDVPSDIRKFKAILKGRKQKWTIEIREDATPYLARIIIAGDWDGDVRTTRELLEEICEKWPKGKRVKFLITCGGFLSFNWPELLPDIGDVKAPNNKAVEHLISEARKCCESLLDRGLCDKLKKFINYITLGADSHSGEGNLRKPHIELVALIDLKRDKWYWTGKTYPITDQKDGLVRINDLKTHFVNLNGEKVMILGCHDLNLLINRGKRTKRKTWRKSIRKDFQDLAVKEKPICVLQHPHTTDSVKIWDAAWGALKKLLPSVKRYASAGEYYNDTEKNYGKPRSKLEEVLKKTKCGNMIDIIVRV